MRTANRILVAMVLLGTGALGLYNGFRELTGVMTTLQRTVSVAAIVYGLCGVAGALTLSLRTRLTVPFAVGWSVGTVYAATVASFAFNDPTFSREGTVAAVSAAALGTIAVSAWVVWSARGATRARSLPRASESGDIPTR